MAGDNIVVFMTFGDLTEAYLVKGILDDNAIPSFISDENVLSVYPLYNQGLGGIKLSVFERDLESAIRLVKEQQEASFIPEDQKGVNSLVDDGPVCPVCGSRNVAYGASVRHKYNWLTIFYLYSSRYIRLQSVRGFIALIVEQILNIGRIKYLSKSHFFTIY